MPVGKLPYLLTGNCPILSTRFLPDIQVQKTIYPNYSLVCLNMMDQQSVTEYIN